MKNKKLKNNKNGKKSKKREEKTNVEQLKLQPEVKLDVDDPRIDEAMASKPLRDITYIVNRYPDILTNERLEKLIRRFDGDLSVIREILLDRYERTNNKNFWDMWDDSVVRAIVDEGYFTQSYAENKILSIIERVEAYQYNTCSAIYFCYNRYRYEIYDSSYDFPKAIERWGKGWLSTNEDKLFSTNYIANAIEKGLHKEILTMAAQGFIRLPDVISKSDMRKFRRRLLSVITMQEPGDTTIRIVGDSRKERKRRMISLFDQTPLLFTLKDIIAVYWVDEELARKFYYIIPHGHIDISQDTIGKLLESTYLQEATIGFLCEYKFVLSHDNQKKLYDWVKDKMSEGKIYTTIFNNLTHMLTLIHKIRESYNITIFFDDFLDVLINSGKKVNSRNVPDIKGWNEKAIMKEFFFIYKSDLDKSCNYNYRSSVDIQKRKLITDLFFWKYLSWNKMHKSDIVILNDYIDYYAKLYPEQTLELARNHPTIVKLNDNAKLDIFLHYFDKDKLDISDYKMFEFAETIDNKIIISASRMMDMINGNDIYLLYKLSQIDQIIIDKSLAEVTKILNNSENISKFKKDIYTLILLQKGRYKINKKRVLKLLRFILSISSNYNEKAMLMNTWRLISERFRPTVDELSIAELGEHVSKLEILRYLLKYQLLKIDNKVVDNLMGIYSHNIANQEIEIIRNLDIPNVEYLRTALNNYEIEQFLTV